MENTIQQAGAVTFKKTDLQVSILLIRSKKDPSKWIFPKGHVEKGETLEETSSRELCEESGISGEIIENIGTVEFEFEQKRYMVTYFLHRYKDTIGAGEVGRDPQWVTPQKALTLLTFPSARSLLQTSMKIILQKQ